MDKVSADSITQITSGFAYPDAKPTGPAPTSDQMIADIRARLAGRVQFLAKSAAKSTQEEQTAFAISRDRAQKDLAKFDDFVAHLPNGFKLAPVWYSKVPSDQAHAVRKQFSEYVRPAFLRFLAEKHADELKAMGVSQRGIERMRTGHNPISEDGKQYSLNVDHIMELAGSGQGAYNKEVDPDMPAGSKPTYIVDHFNNFVLLPIATHELKNMLNMMQGMDKIQPGHGGWILMMVPEKAPGYSGFVARPLHGAKNMAAGNAEKLPVHKTDPTAIAAEDFFFAMNTIENSDQKLMKPAFDELALALTDAFNQASVKGGNIQDFRHFYDTELADIRPELPKLAQDETTKLSAAITSIDNSLRARFPKDYQEKKLANSNVPSAVPPAQKLKAVRFG